MQWKKITTSLGNSAYSLWSNGHKLLTLAYGNQSDAVYLESETGEKRLFHYKKQGLFKNRTVLENEYGVGLGRIKKEAGREFIEMDDTRYYFSFKNNQVVEIINEATDQPVAVCSLEMDNPTEQTRKGLLMVCCLYLAGHNQTYQQASLV
ncbi:hypothetical protein GCM10027051_00190 [Niabella terrae]